MNASYFLQLWPEIILLDRTWPALHYACASPGKAEVAHINTPPKKVPAGTLEVMHIRTLRRKACAHLRHRAAQMHDTCIACRRRRAARASSRRRCRLQAAAASPAWRRPRCRRFGRRRRRAPYRTRAMRSRASTARCGAGAWSNRQTLQDVRAGVAPFKSGLLSSRACLMTLRLQPTLILKPYP